MQVRSCFFRLDLLTVLVAQADSLRLAFLLSPVKFRPLQATCAASPFGLPTLLLQDSTRCTAESARTICCRTPGDDSSRPARTRRCDQVIDWPHGQSSPFTAPAIAGQSLAA